MTEDNKARGITPPKGLISWDELEDLKQNYTPKQIEKLFERCMPKLSKNMMNQFVSFLEDTFKEKYETVTAITFKLKEDEN